MVEKGILLEELLKLGKQYSYDFNFQFWRDFNCCYVSRDNVDIYDYGGEDTPEPVMENVIAWIYRVNRVPEEKQLGNANPYF